MNESGISHTASIAAATTLFRFSLVIVAVLMRPANGPVFAQFPDMREMIENEELNRCGPYALQACANFLGSPVRQEDLRKDLPNGEVTTFKQLADLASKQGLVAVPIRWKSDPIMLSDAPAILATKKDGVPHFVAALAKQGDKVYIIDLPGAGWMSLQVLRERLHWNGESLHIAKSNLSILWLYVLVYYRGILLGAVVGVACLLLVMRRVGARIAGKRIDCCRACRMFLVFVCAACGCINSGCRRNSFEASRHLARVEPEQVTIDRSKVATVEDGVAETVLSVVNDGKETIIIPEIVSSCGCAVVKDPSKTSLKPGETASVPLRIDLPQHGERRSRVMILVEAGHIQQRLLAQILMRGLPIQAPAVIKAPSEVVLRCDAEGNATTTFRIVTYEKETSRSWIERVTVEPAIVAVEYLGMKETDSSEKGVVRRTYGYSLKVQEIGDNSQSVARITLDSTDSGVPVAKVLVQLNKWKPYYLVPKVLFVDMVAGTPDCLEREVRVVFADKRFCSAKIDPRPTADWINVKSVVLKKRVDACEAVIVLGLLRNQMGEIGTIRGNVVVRALNEKGNTVEATIPIWVKMRPPT